MEGRKTRKCRRGIERKAKMQLDDRGVGVGRKGGSGIERRAIGWTD